MFEILRKIRKKNGVLLRLKKVTTKTSLELHSTMGRLLNPSKTKVVLNEIIHLKILNSELLCRLSGMTGRLSALKVVK